MTIQLLPLSAADYQRHPLHAQDREWPETNCYVDLWIEVLHALGVEPLAAAGFTLSTDFEGDQWTFFKFPPEDLRSMFGIEVAEMNVWRPLPDHVSDHLELGRLLTVEVDAWYLPDTREVSYRTKHEKTTIVPQMIDREGRRLGYFHNRGYYELEGDDFEGVLRLTGGDDSGLLPPYVELVKLDRFRRCDEQRLVGDALGLAEVHLRRRPPTSPMARFRKQLEADLPWLTSAGLASFHAYAFATCRQCGASAEVAASLLEWLNDHDVHGLDQAARGFRAVAAAAKVLQFTLARAVRGRRVDVASPLEEMEREWERAIAGLVEIYGS